MLWFDVDVKHNQMASFQHGCHPLCPEHCTGPKVRMPFPLLQIHNFCCAPGHRHPKANLCLFGEHQGALSVSFHEDFVVTKTETS